MRAAIYSRVSTEDQQSAAQAAACREEIERRGWELVGAFTDDGISGMTISRPGFDAMMAAVRAGTVGAVVAAAGDRLGRSTIHVMQIEEELRERGVALVLLRGNVDTSTPAGLLMFTVLAGMARFERDLIADRTRAALRYGRPSACDWADRRPRRLRPSGAPSWPGRR